MPSQLYRRLRADQLLDANISDFESIILGHFNRAYFPPLPAIARNQDDSDAIEIRYSKRGRVLDVVARNVPEATLQAIEASLNSDLFSTPVWKVARRTVFAPLPIAKSFTRGDEWQLLPMPQNAPRPEESWAPWPGLFEVRYRGAAGVWTEQARAQLAVTRAITKLNGVLKLKLHPERSNGQKLWVVGDQPPYLTSSLKQIGYFYDSSSLGAGFSDVTKFSKMGNADPSAYYNAWGITVGDEFEMPSNVNDSLDTIEGLHPADQDRFLRASYWANAAGEISRVSSSASIVAAVTAIEVLGVSPAARTKADGAVVGSRESYRAVMREALGDDYEKKYALYGLRSGIAHGNQILLADTQGWGTGLHSRQEEEVKRFVNQVLPLVLLNWLDEDVRKRISAHEPVMGRLDRLISFITRMSHRIRAGK